MALLTPDGLTPAFHQSQPCHVDDRAVNNLVLSPSSLELRAAFFCDHSIALLAEEAPRPRLVTRIGLQPLRGEVAEGDVSEDEKR